MKINVKYENEQEHGHGYGNRHGQGHFTLRFALLVRLTSFRFVFLLR